MEFFNSESKILNKYSALTLRAESWHTETWSRDRDDLLWRWTVCSIVHVWAAAPPREASAGVCRQLCVFHANHWRPQQPAGSQSHCKELPVASRMPLYRQFHTSNCHHLPVECTFYPSNQRLPGVSDQSPGQHEQRCFDFLFAAVVGALSAAQCCSQAP